jgi:hypothetical protein
MQLSNKLYDIINQEISADINILKSRDEQPVFEVNGYLTSSKYRPIKEAQKISTENYKKHHFHILLGIGSGYIAEELYSMLGDHERLLIVEPNKKLLEMLSETRCFNDLQKVNILSGLAFEQLEKYLAPIVTEYNNRIQLIISPNYDKLYPHFIKQVMVKIEEALMLEVVNRNTLRQFANDWQENFINNLNSAFKSIPFSLLSGKLSCPIVIASGGPSLIKQIPLIKENRNSFLLLCAGSTINTLLANEIIPDAIVSIDGGIENFKHFKNMEDFRIPLFYSAMVHKDILKLHTGKKIIFNNMSHNQSAKIINDLLQYEVGEIVGGGSVANFSLDIAYKLTSGPICLIGQDLAYTGNVTHAKGNENFAIIGEKQIEERKMFKINGYYGEEVLTDYPFYSMKKSFEIYLEYVNRGDRKNNIYNCTEGGALIKGCENLPFTSFLNKFCKKPVPQNFTRLLNEITIEKTQEQWKELYEYVEYEKQTSEKARLLCKEAQDLLLKLNHYSPNFTNKVLKKLEKLDNRLKELLKNELLFYLFQDVIFSINNNFLEKETETADEKQKRIYFKSMALYKGIQSSSEKSIKWYGDLLDNILEEMSGSE